MFGLFKVKYTKEAKQNIKNNRRYVIELGKQMKNPIKKFSIFMADVMCNIYYHFAFAHEDYINTQVDIYDSNHKIYDTIYKNEGK